MNLKKKLALRSTLVFAITLAIVFAGTLYFFDQYLSNQFFHQLRERALTTAIIFLEKDELNKRKYQEYEQAYNQVVTEELAQIYDTSDRVRFNPEIPDFPVSNEFLEQVRQTGMQEFQEGGRQFSAIFYQDNQGDFVIVLSGINAQGRAQLQNLALLLAVALLVGLLINYQFNIALARRTFRPFTSILNRVNALSAENLHHRLAPPSASKDELALLVTTLNTFLERLENEVNNQKQFLKNVSHELNTPLTAIIGQAEVSLEKSSSPAELQAVLQKIIKDTFDLKTVIQSLLLISGLQSAKSGSKPQAFRLDELVWASLEKLKFKYPQAIINTSLEIESEDEGLLELVSHRELLATALLNIIDNAIKYSQSQEIDIRITKNSGRLMLQVKDDGPGIPAGEAENVYELFYRGSNIRHIPGHGIGLSVTRQIVAYCQMEMQIAPAPDKGTVVSLLF
ncbi:HAMP domain-containing sensor histidine kinase [Cesiribacter sp. SM1]|uniref:sensor histidine kinase n=1 Tax=Cesiribacter sp. SM1 TaxID=2861196 RepID=UPI001CD1B309|nr:HAMP domain-containing sensor histidine kinase [Cesiribacter sp. SM1]